MTDTAQLEQFKQLLHITQQGNNQRRKEAERSLEGMSQSTLVPFVQNLMLVVNQELQGGKDEEEHAPIRKLAAIMFKNRLQQGIFKQNGPPRFETSAWFKLDEDTRKRVKDMLLGTLGNAQSGQLSQEYLKDLCVCLSVIAVVEIPTGNWPGYVEMMSTQAQQSENKFFQMAGILNLGYLQDGLRADDFSEQDIHIMWGAMLSNINPDNLELSGIVATSITNLAPTAKAHFGDEGKRVGIMNGLFDLLKMNDETIRLKSLEALLIIAQENYRFMGPYLDQFYLMAESFIQNGEDDDKIARSSIELWSCLFEEELLELSSDIPEKVQIIQQFQWEKVAKLCLFGLQRTGLDANHEDDGDDQEQTMVSSTCYTAINLLAQIVRDNILEPTFEQFKSWKQQEEANQGQGQWLIRYVAMLALCSTIEGPSPQTLQSAYAPQLEWVFQNAMGGPILLRRRVARFFTLIAQHCPDLIVEDHGIFTTFQQWYENCLTNEKPEVILGATQAMGQLFICLEECEPQKNFKLNSIFVNVIQVTISKVLDKSLVDTGYLSPVMDCLNDITQHCDHQGLSDALFQLCRSIIQQLEENILSDENPNGYSVTDKEVLVNNFGGLLQILIVRLQGRLSEGTIAEDVLRVLSVVCTHPACRGGALLILNGLLNALPVEKVEGISKIILDVIEQTITDREDKFDMMCQRLATGLLQDLATSLQDRFTEHLERGFNLVNTILEQDHFSTEVKTIGIIALGDICLMSESAFNPYLEKTMSLLIEAGKMTLNLDGSVGPDERMVLFQLSKAIIEAFLGIINGIKSPGQEQRVEVTMKITQHIQSMFYYIEGMLRNDQLDINNPEFARQIIDLYTDIVITGFASENNEMGRGGQQHPDLAADVQQLRNDIKSSGTHDLIVQRFGNLVPRISKADGGQEAITRFQDMVNIHINSQ